MILLKSQLEGDYTLSAIINTLNSQIHLGHFGDEQGFLSLKMRIPTQ